ncbi:Ferroporti-1 [Acrodontium crateriforme]|uniref:Ferroporti-1 n=1 Tax=Acrodontium crateriforme TaxID=150365 RepID=A0AAQ3MBF1_9PEZI|nr:Ferroporti-1 [Acrodontium crateriforme]
MSFSALSTRGNPAQATDIPYCHSENCEQYSPITIFLLTPTRWLLQSWLLHPTLRSSAVKATVAHSRLRNARHYWEKLDLTCFTRRPLVPASGLIIATNVSRLGLRGFELSVQVIVQEHRKWKPKIAAYSPP